MDHPQEDLAKFGSRSETKVDFFSQTLLYTGNIQKDLCSKYGEFYFFPPPKYGNFVHFSSTNPLDKVEAPFVLSPKKKKKPCPAFFLNETLNNCIQFQNGFLIKSSCFGHWPCYLLPTKIQFIL